MFRARPDGVAAIRFPAAVLPRLWKAASAREPELLVNLDDDPLTGELNDPATAATVAAASVWRRRRSCATGRT